MICAFSSDFRQLYKADIYRALALPVGHILHFRYKSKYVDSNLRVSGANLKGRTVVIFYTHGNKGQDGLDALGHVSIRKATIVDHYVSADTDVFHVYMKLGAFCNVQVDTGNSAEKMPLKNFFAELNCSQESHENNWQARVNALKDLLPPLTYFSIKGIFRNGKELGLRYSEDQHSCFYRLDQGSRHILKVALGNPNSTTAKVGIAESGQDVSINVVKPMETSAQFDDFDVPLIVENLQVFKKPALLTFEPEIDNLKYAEFATNVEMELHSGYLKPALFGLFSTLAFGTLLIAQPKNAAVEWLSWKFLVAAAVLFWFSTSALYFGFNKK